MLDKGNLTLFNNYGPFADFVKNGTITIQSSDITITTWQEYFDGVLNMLRDGIETEFLQKSFVKIVFPEGEVELSVPDCFINLIMWYMIVKVNKPIHGKHIFFEKYINQKAIKNWIDKFFIEENRTKLTNREINNIIDDSISNFRYINDFALYFANTINLKDNIELMNKNPEFYELLHTDFTSTPIEDIKDVSMAVTNESIKHIIDADKLLGHEHCMAASFKTKEAINPKQYREFSTCIGAKPDGTGKVFPFIINNSFINGGLASVEDYFIESSAGRIAQILKKGNVGDSGAFARSLGLNNMDTLLHPDPNYDCMSSNYEEIIVKNETILRMYRGRYYKLNPNGNLYNIGMNDTHLIGQKIYLRSPMTCASHARDEGICYKCYGDLAYTNSDINAGKMAAELLSAILTQILLSAKHLLEVSVKKLRWVPEFDEYFDIESNIVRLNPDTVFGKNFLLAIDPDDIHIENEELSDTEEEFHAYNEYITKLFIILPNGDQIQINELDYNKLFIEPGLNNNIRNKAKNVNGLLAVPLQNLEGLELFSLMLTNNELSSVMNRLINILDKKDVTSSMDRHQILQAFIDTVAEGNVDIGGVHCELLLSNQIKDPDNILEKPDWTIPNVPYSIQTLNSSLVNNPSIIVSLMYQKLGKTLINPLSYKKNKCSFLDLFFMEKPQEFLSDKSIIVPGEKDPSIDEPMIEAMRFIEPDEDDDT